MRTRSAIALWLTSGCSALALAACGGAAAGSAGTVAGQRPAAAQHPAAVLHLGAGVAVEAQPQAPGGALSGRPAAAPLTVRQSPGPLAPAAPGHSVIDCGPPGSQCPPG